MAVLIGKIVEGAAETAPTREVKKAADKSIDEPKKVAETGDNAPKTVKRNRKPKK